MPPISKLDPNSAKKEKKESEEKKKNGQPLRGRSRILLKTVGLEPTRNYPLVN